MSDAERIERLERIVAALFEIIRLRGSDGSFPNWRVSEAADELLPEWRELNQKGRVPD